MDPTGDVVELSHVDFEHDINMSNICQRLQALQQVVMATKSMMFTCFYNITSRKCS